MKKYEMIPLGDGTYRIKALKNFFDVSKGDLGGIIKSSANLSQMGYCWIYPDAVVIGNARVEDDARIIGGKVCNNAIVSDRAVIDDNAIICNDAYVCEFASVSGSARVGANAIVRGYTIICNNAYVCGFASVSGFAKVGDNAIVKDYASVLDSAEIAGDVVINGRACITGNAYVESISDFIVFKNWWSSGRHFTWTRSDNKWRVGCFHGSGAELIKKAYEDSEESGKRYEEIVKYVENIIK